MKKRLKAREKAEKKAAKDKAREDRAREGRAGEDDEATPAERAKSLEAKGELTEAVIAKALGGGDRAFVKAALAEKSGLGEAAIAKVLDARSAKGVVSLAWKAGFRPRPRCSSRPGWAASRRATCCARAAAATP